nr:hypothetical protein [Tanacetum cinerariifolium]
MKYVSGLRELDKDDDIVNLIKYVSEHKVIEVYIEHHESLVEPLDEDNDNDEDNDMGSERDNEQWKGGVSKDLLWRAATSTTTVYFDKAMDELKAYNIKAYKWLKKIPAKNWSRSHFSGRANCDLLINNICKIFIRQLLEAKDLPIIPALEYTREYLMKRIVIVQKVIEKSQGPHGDQYVVNLTKRNRSCRKWEVSGIPCKHAVACIHDMADHGIDVGLPKAWFHPAYKLETWRQQYSFKINPVNGRNLWEKNKWPTTFLPPKVVVPVGRPPKKRKRSAGEVKTLVTNGKIGRKSLQATCLSYKGKGHNKRGCKANASNQQ